MKIDIIGGSGFIGTRLGELLEAEERDEFRIDDKRPSARFGSRCMIADARSVDALRQAIEPGSYIVNLAAEHRDNVRPVELYEEVNVLGARNICTVTRAKGVNAILFTSSVAVYGEANWVLVKTPPSGHSTSMVGPRRRRRSSVAKLTNRQFPISAVRIRKFCSDSSFSTNASALGFKAPYPLQDALRRTISSEFHAQ